MKINDYTQEQVEVAAQTNSIKEFLISLGLEPNNGQYRRAKHIAHQYNVTLPVFDTSKATEKAISRVKKPDSVFFAKNTHYNGQHIKKRLISGHGWIDACQIIGCPSPQPEWNGMPLVLQLDHIDGDNRNNEISNLRIICPNCHTQTETFSNKKHRIVG